MIYKTKSNKNTCSFYYEINTFPYSCLSEELKDILSAVIDSFRFILMLLNKVSQNDK